MPFSSNTTVLVQTGTLDYSAEAGTATAISSVQVGDYVLTARGTWKPVLAVTTQSYSGEAFDLGSGQLATSQTQFLRWGEWCFAHELVLQVDRTEIEPGPVWPSSQVSAQTFYDLSVEHDPSDDGSLPGTERSYKLSNVWVVRGT